MLTDTSIRNLKRKASAYRVFDKSKDATLRGFHVKVLPSGKKQFFLQYKDSGGKVRYLKLGDYPKPTLSEARELCREARKGLEQGVDPTMERERRRRAEEAERKRLETERERENAAATVSDLLLAYTNTLANPRTAKDARQTFEKNIIPTIGKNKATTVSVDDLLPLIEAVSDRGAHSVARNLYGYLHAAWQHGIRKKAVNGKLLGLTVNPWGFTGLFAVLSAWGLAAFLRRAAIQ